MKYRIVEATGNGHVVREFGENARQAHSAYAAMKKDGKNVKLQVETLAWITINPLLTSRGEGTKSKKVGGQSV